MPRYNVEHNGKWACFSSISDGFITNFVDKSQYEEWRKVEYGLYGYKPLKERNIMTMKEAVFSIRLNRTHDEAIECLLESGLSKAECEQIMFDMETEYYCPIPKENGNFECPNCRSEVKQDQEICENDTCELSFVWRHNS